MKNMASQVKNNNSNFLVEEKGAIATVSSKEHSDYKVSFYLFDDNIIDKLSEFNAKGKGLSVQEIMDEYGLALPLLINR